MIYDKDKKALASTKAILEHMGYSTGGKEGKSGTAGRAVSALRQFGLLDEIGGNYRVSEDGFRLLHLPSDSHERLEMIKKAALKPVLFKKVLEYFDYDLPSETTLTSHLILSEGFNPDSVRKFIRSLRRTKEFAMLSGSDYSLTSSDDEAIEGELFPAEEPMAEQPQQQYRTIAPGKAYAGATLVSVEAPADHVFSYQLSFPRNVRAEVRIWGIDLRRQDIERLQKEVGELAGAFDEESDSENRTEKPPNYVTS
jgi:hypothetical protein